jgi:hypothetical protein
MVIKYEFVPGSMNDIATLFINPNLSNTEPLPTVTALDFSSTDAVTLDRIGIRQEKTRAIIDGIRVSKTWADIPLPVELSSFTGTLHGTNSVELKWITTEEHNNAHFDIERKTGNTEWSLIGSLSGMGNSSAPHPYLFIDRNLNAGLYLYRLKQIDYNGNFQYYNLSKPISIGTPEKFTVSQNYPNPFNPITKIDYTLSVNSRVVITVYDITGRKVFSETTQRLAGYYQFSFNAQSMPSGMYIYEVRSDEFKQTRKMVVLK